MNRRLALIIGNSHYQDANLAKLVAPTEDVNSLTDVLRDGSIGGFEAVITLIDENDATIRLSIEDFFADKNPDDLLVLYFSGHGVRDEQGQLYLAVNNTRANRLRATAIAAEFVTREMDRSRSKRQVLILDCCHSGAFAQGAKALTGESAGTGPSFEGNGYGRVVLTATDATQYAWEGDQIIGEADKSLFTHYMVEGLRTGAADRDADGRITLDEMYDYVYEHVVTKTPKQTPGKWSYRQQGDIVIARNPKPIVKAAELPPDLRNALENSVANVRFGAVRELERLLNGSNAALAMTAFDALHRLVDDDSRSVSSAAASVLQAYAEKQRAHEEQGRVAREQAEQTRLAKERAEADRQAAINSEQERIAKGKAEAERLERLRAERERTARQPSATDRFTLPSESPSPPQARLSLRGALALTVTLAVVFWAVLIGSAGLRRSSSSDVVPPYLGALAVCLMLVVVRRWVKALTPGRMIVIALSWLISGGLVYPLGYYHGGVGDILFIMLLPAVVGLGVAYWLLH